MRTSVQTRPRATTPGQRPKSKARAPRVQSSIPAPGVALQEFEAQSAVGPESLDRAMALLARWACRRGEKVLKGTGIDPRNPVTADDVGGYGAHGKH